ncbi:MAG TPA: hypothetical protein VGP17_02555 [Solirubrobacteraceae bacterium]|jgi:alkylation response protein AidB-like acyl-CoA dehydrogenase|nr:hypothetical protein [Solirubrobacteraceae bacterium]
MLAERMPPTPEAAAVLEMVREVARSGMKVMQIFEGTNQIQRMVITRDWAASHANDPTGRITCR